MDNDNQQQEEKSLLKEMAKKGISKKIKTIPLKTKLIIAGIIAGIVFFLLIFIVLVSTLSMLFFFNDDTESNDESSNLGYVDSNSEDNYWWPIGGSVIEKKNGIEYATGEPSTTNITSYYGYRVMDGATVFHGGIDVSFSGTQYVISVANGTVVSSYNGCDNNGYYGNRCGGGYGNYILIEHTSGIKTRYAHLKPNTIRVSVGDSVEQGQIIAEMGNSGSSTGQHLHFEVIDLTGSTVDPLTYVSVENPRPVTVDSGYTGSSNLLSMIQKFEGTGPTAGDNYLVYADTGGVLTVGYGVTLIYNKEKFTKRGIDINTLSVGSAVKKSIVDDIKLEIVQSRIDYVKNTISNAGITLKDYQIDALASRAYNTGNINGFVTAYNTYGDTQALYNNYMSGPITDIKGNVLSALKMRREVEWNLFHNGIYY